VQQRAKDAGVEAIIIAGAARTAADMERTVALAERTGNGSSPTLFASCGVHPHEAKHFDAALEAALEKTSLRPSVVAIGESGLDYHYDHSPRDAQKRVFERHLALSATRDLPIICHIRDAHDDAIAILTASNVRRGVIHCFTGGPDDAERYLELGFHLSFSGIITFGKNAEPIREAAKLAPLDRILIETDAPFLAPVPERGKRNEPAFIVHTAARLAKIRSEPIASVAAQTTANAQDLFRLK